MASSESLREEFLESRVIHWGSDKKWNEETWKKPEIGDRIVCKFGTCSWKPRKVISRKVRLHMSKRFSRLSNQQISWTSDNICSERDGAPNRDYWRAAAEKGSNQGAEKIQIDKCSLSGTRIYGQEKAMPYGNRKEHKKSKWERMAGDAGIIPGTSRGCREMRSPKRLALAE